MTKKTAVCAVIAVILILSLISCVSGQSDPGTSSGADTDSTTTTQSTADRHTTTPISGDNPEIGLPDFGGCDIYAVGSPLSDESINGYARRFIDAINSHESFFAVDDAAIGDTLCDNIFFCYPPSALCNFSAADGGISIEYLYPKEVHNEKTAAFFRRVREVIDSTTDDSMSPTRKAMELYRWVSVNISYFSVDYTERQTSSFNALLEGQTICYGFADTYNYLLRQVGIPAELIFGERSDGAEHGWSLITIDGSSFHCDPTWERSGASNGQGLFYFGMTDSERRSSTTENARIGSGSGAEMYQWNRCTDGMFGAVQRLPKWTWDNIQSIIERNG